MLNSTEHEILTANKTKIPTNEDVFALSLTDGVFVMLKNVKMLPIVGILTFMSRIISVLKSVEYEKSFITSGLTRRAPRLTRVFTGCIRTFVPALDLWCSAQLS